MRGKEGKKIEPGVLAQAEKIEPGVVVQAFSPGAQEAEAG